MLIVGAGGLVLQMFDDLKEQTSGELFCWASVPVKSRIIADNATIFSTDDEILEHFKRRGNKCILGIGKPSYREALTKKFEDLGGEFISFFSKSSLISKYSDIRQCVVLKGAIIDAGVEIGKGSLINNSAVITHECKLGRFVEIGPGAILAGSVQIGDGSFIGAGTVIRPRIRLGRNVIVGAGAVVVKDVPDNITVVGVPAKPLINES